MCMYGLCVYMGYVCVCVCVCVCQHANFRALHVRTRQGPQQHSLPGMPYMYALCLVYTPYMYALYVQQDKDPNNTPFQVCLRVSFGRSLVTTFLK